MNGRRRGFSSCALPVERARLVDQASNAAALCWAMPSAIHSRRWDFSGEAAFDKGAAADRRTAPAGDLPLLASDRVTKPSEARAPEVESTCAGPAGPDRCGELPSALAIPSPVVGVTSAAALTVVKAEFSGIAEICRNSTAIGRIILLGIATSLPSGHDYKGLFINTLSNG